MSHLVMHRRERLRLRIAPQAAAALASPGSLDITDIAHYPVREPVSGNRYSLLRIKTRSGLIGWGECAFDSTADLKLAQSEWMGKPANAYATIKSSTPFRAAIDIALLDIV